MRAYVRVCTRSERTRTLRNAPSRRGSWVWEPHSPCNTLVYVYMYVHICSYRERRHSLKRFRGCAMETSQFFPRDLCSWTTRKYLETRRRLSVCGYREVERGAATSPDKRALYGNSVELIRRDRCEHGVVVFALARHAGSASKRIYVMRLLERSSCCRRYRIV